MSFETIIQQILDRRPEITRERLLNRLDAARDMTGGLIEDTSLLRMIAAELSIDIPNENGEFKHRLSLGHLVAGLSNVTVTGRIVAIYPIRTFEGAKPGKFASVTIVDNDGVLRVILWNEKTAPIESGELKIGQIVKFIHGYTKADRFGTPELHIGERSQIELDPKDTNTEDFPSIAKFATKVSKIVLEQKYANLEGRVKEVYSASTFTRSDQTSGKVLRLKIADETGAVTVVFWNEKAEEIETKLKRGADIQIVNARVKPSQSGDLELHVDSSAYVKLEEIQKQVLKIVDLSEDSGDITIEGEVASLPVCREVKTFKDELVKLTAFDLKDETGLVRVTAWREQADSTCKLLMGEKIVLENVYPKMGYNGKIELSTRSITVVTRV
jgi:ssDNA-binding replication factor A large subunit